MPENIEQLIKIQFEDAPEEMRALLISDQFTNIILGIGELFELDATAKNAILNEVTLVCLGLSSLEDLAKNITPIIGGNSEIADDIATQAFEMVLFENLGFIPTTISPRAETLLQEIQTEEEGNTLSAGTTIPHTEVPAVPDQTATQDSPSVPNTPLSEEVTPQVPRYAKPLTDIPRYEDTNP